MEHKTFKTTKLKRDNLIKLANYLYSLKENYTKFDMWKFCESNEVYKAEPIESIELLTKEISCGAVACALGHGVMAGIDVTYSGDWPSYSKRNFIETWSDQWLWCFSGGWYNVDNTPKGAALRIRYLLEKGLPQNWQGQLEGSEELTYLETENE